MKTIGIIAFFILVLLVLILVVEYVLVSILLQIKFTIELIGLRDEISGFDDDTKIEMLLAMKDLDIFRKAITDRYLRTMSWRETWMSLMSYCLLWPSYHKITNYGN